MSTAMLIEGIQAEARSFRPWTGILRVDFGVSVCGDDAIHHHAAMMKRGEKPSIVYT